MSNVQKWGFFPDFDAATAKGDKEAIEACERGATFRIDTETADALEITFKGSRATVPKAGLWYRPAPPFSWGDHVYVSSKDMHAEIDDICWHFKDKYYYFYLICDGKSLKKRYLVQDLEGE